MAEIKHWLTDREYLDSANIKIKYKDYFHIKNLYIMMREWLVEEEYSPVESWDFPEDFYLQRETQRKGTEMWIWWRLKKVPSGNSYYRYILDVDFHVLWLKEAEVIHQGQKFKTNWGEIEITIIGKLEKDYMHEEGKGWRDHFLLKHFDNLFHKRIFKKDLDMHRLEFKRDVYRFQEAIKTYLKMRVFLPEPESTKFWPEKGLGEVK